jgi:hypothetical protein
VRNIYEFRQCEVAGTLYAILGQCVGQERFTIIIDEKKQKIRESRKIEQFAKFVLSCSLRSHHKTNPTPKMARHIWLCPPKVRNIAQNYVKNLQFKKKVVSLPKIVRTLNSQD